MLQKFFHRTFYPPQNQTLPITESVQIPLSIILPKPLMSVLPSFSLEPVIVAVNNFEGLYSGLTWDKIWIVNMRLTPFWSLITPVPSRPKFIMSKNIRLLGHFSRVLHSFDHLVLASRQPQRWPKNITDLPKPHL